MLNEICQKEKDKHCIILFTQEVERKNKHTGTENRLVVAKSEVSKVGAWLKGTHLK